MNLMTLYLQEVILSRYFSYMMMLACWSFHGPDRPTFPQLVVQLRSLLHRHAPDPYNGMISAQSEPFYSQISPGRIYSNMLASQFN